MGVLMLFESVNYGLFHCVECVYQDTDMLFKYRYFGWVSPPPGHWIYALFVVMGLSSIGVILGWHYRVSIVVLTVTVAWYFLLDAALYLNHYYLALLFLGILCFIPANRVWALDARRYPQSPYIGNWARLWLIVQLEIVLIYAGAVKLTPDWLQLEPLRFWMTTYASGAGPVFEWLTQDAGIALGAYGVIALHLFGAPLLLFRRTRLPVFCLYLVFHSINAAVFNIGIFPFMTAAATTLVFAPDWPLKLLQRLKRAPSSLSETPISFDQPNPAVIGLVVFAACWLCIQALLPLRPLLYPGNVGWNEAGHYFSWRMKLRDKRGVVSFVVDNKKTNTQTVVDARDHLTPKQVRKMACHPDLIWQYAKHLENETLTAAKPDTLTEADIAVFSNARCSLNTRAPQSLIKPLDLTAIARNTPRHEWVTELTGDLPNAS